MPSKTSKRRRSPQPSPWKVARSCAEYELAQIARELAEELKVGDRVLLEGPMGAGKSTFARALLNALGVVQPPEGSPTFAIAHEYASPRGGVVHVDLYRLRSEDEIEAAGIHSYIWERDLFALIEWTSMWPEFERSLLESDPGGKSNWRISLMFDETPDRRSVQIEKL